MAEWTANKHLLIRESGARYKRRLTTPNISPPHQAPILALGFLLIPPQQSVLPSRRPVEQTAHLQLSIRDRAAAAAVAATTTRTTTTVRKQFVLLALQSAPLPLPPPPHRPAPSPRQSAMMARGSQREPARANLEQEKQKQFAAGQAADTGTGTGTPDDTFSYIVPIGKLVPSTLPRCPSRRRGRCACPTICTRGRSTHCCWSLVPGLALVKRHRHTGQSLLGLSLSCMASHGIAWHRIGMGIGLPTASWPLLPSPLATTHRTLPRVHDDALCIISDELQIMSIRPHR